MKDITDVVNKHSKIVYKDLKKKHLGEYHAL